jgi:hypothetical protein
MNTPQSTAKNSRKKAQETQKTNWFLFLQVLSFLCIFVANSVFAYSGGTGEPNTPYQIADVNDLLQLANDANDYNKCFILTADISLAGYVFTDAVISYYVPNAGQYGRFPFTGTFDGACHKISNLTINSNSSGSCLGLFGYIKQGDVNNLGLENVSITGGSAWVGGLVGLNIEGTINNCYSIGSVAGVVKSLYVGGLVGENYLGIISNCYSKGIVSSAGGYIGPDFSADIGGLVGLNSGDYVTISLTRSYSTCNVICGGYTNWVGGLVGGGVSISECFSTGDVNAGANSRYIGGFAGEGCGIINCYSTGDVTGGDTSAYIGGLIGCYLSPGVEYDIANCYSTGNVTGRGGSYSIGGLVGYNHYSSDINSCYFLDTSGPDNGYGEPLTDPNMRKQASFAGWDFVGETINGTEDIWWILENITYPKLNWQRIIPPGPCGLGGPGGPGGPDDGGIYFPDYDFDNFVNFIDFAIFANAWLTENPFISLDADSDVDIYDLKIFCDYWLTYTNNIGY